MTKRASNLSKRFGHLRGGGDDRMRYFRLLPRQKLPAGFYLVHNHVVPVKPLGLNGFRAWVQQGKDDPPLVRCRCDFGGNANADVNEHYRVKR